MFGIQVELPKMEDLIKLEAYSVIKFPPYVKNYKYGMIYSPRIKGRYLIDY